MLFFFGGGEIEKEPNNFMKHMIFGIFFSDKRVFFHLAQMILCSE
jgi:hypothetical protein